MEFSETRTLRSETPWGELALQLRGGPRGGAALILDGAFLMDSDAAESERRLARRGLEVWAATSGGAASAEQGRHSAPCRVLVAGLGLGLTLRALLADPRVGRVEVVELLAPLVAWNRGALAGLNASKHANDD